MSNSITRPIYKAIAQALNEKQRSLVLSEKTFCQICWTVNNCYECFLEPIDCSIDIFENLKKEVKELENEKKA